MKRTEADLESDPLGERQQRFSYCAIRVFRGQQLLFAGETSALSVQLRYSLVRPEGSTKLTGQLLSNHAQFHSRP